MEGGTVSIVSPSGTSATQGTYDGGTQVEVRATPKAGYSFVKWSNKKTKPTISFTLDASLSLTASFTQQSYNLTINQSEGGTVSVSPVSGSSTNGGAYDAGRQITLTATPNTGYEFEHWSEVPANSYLNRANSKSLTLSFTINKNITFTPRFESIYTGNYSDGIYIDKEANENQYFHKEGNGSAKIVMSDQFLEKNASNFNASANVHGIRVRSSFKKYFGSKTYYTLYSFEGNNETSFDAVHTPSSETVIISSSRGISNPFNVIGRKRFTTEVNTLKGINALYIQSLENAGVDKAKDKSDGNKEKVATYPHVGVSYIIQNDAAAKAKTIFVAFYGKRRPTSTASFNRRVRGWVDLHGDFVINNLNDIIFVELPDDFFSNGLRIRNTSSSTPLVAGFAAGILAGDRNLTAEQLKTKVMEQTVRKKIKIRDYRIKKDSNGQIVMENGKPKEERYTVEKMANVLEISKWKQ